jgi:hypothetical protein
MRRILVHLAVAVFLAVPCVAQARLTKFVVYPELSESPTFGGYSWPGVGQYEKIVGKGYAEVDPFDPKNLAANQDERETANAQVSLFLTQIAPESSRSVVFADC